LKKIAIIGSEGFIGSNIADALNKDFILSCYRSIDVEYLKPNPKTSFDLIIYACEPSLTSLYDSELIKQLKDRKHMVLNRLQGHYLYLSSTLVYDNFSEKAEISEKSDINLKSNYAKFKYQQEKGFIKNGMTVFRLSNIIGPRMSANSLVSKIFSDLDKKSKTVELREINSFVNYLDVRDLISAIRLLIHDINKTNGIYNLASNKDYSIPNLVDYVAKELKLENWNISSKSKGFVNNRRIISIDKMKTDFGWEPKISIKSSIKNLRAKK
jgi:nucleoside-diphosphate-sugar epimerase